MTGHPGLILPVCSIPQIEESPERASDLPKVSQSHLTTPQHTSPNPGDGYHELFSLLGDPAKKPLWGRADTAGAEMGMLEGHQALEARLQVGSV